MSSRTFLPAATKLGQGNIFTSVCPSTGGKGCLPQCMLGYLPLGGRPPQSRHREQTPPGADTPPRRQTPLGADTPRTRHPPWEQTPPDQAHPLQSRHTPPGGRPPRRQTPPDQAPPQEQTPPGSKHPPGADTPGQGTQPSRSRLQHTVNERPVRILLECILVIFCFRTCANCLAIITLILGQLARLLFLENRQYQFTWTTVHDIANKCLQYVVKNACI